MKCRHCGKPLSGNTVDWCPTCTNGKAKPGAGQITWRTLLAAPFMLLTDPVFLLGVIIVLVIILAIRTAGA